MPEGSSGCAATERNVSKLRKVHQGERRVLHCFVRCFQRNNHTVLHTIVLLELVVAGRVFVARKLEVHHGAGVAQQLHRLMVVVALERLPVNLHKPPKSSFRCQLCWVRKLPTGILRT